MATIFEWVSKWCELSRLVLLYINAGHDVKLEMWSWPDKEENSIKSGATNNAMLPDTCWWE